MASDDDVRCVNAHDRCYGGAGGPCPYCEPVPKTTIKGRWFGLRPTLGYWRQWFLAYFRLDPVAVCGMSSGRGEYDDFHDYPDSEIGAPLHDYLHTCKRCGKGFRI